MSEHEHVLPGSAFAAPVRVFAVDDDPSVLAMFEFLCSKRRPLQLVGTASSAREAIEKIPSVLPDVLVIDIQMGGMSGIECAQHLHLLLPRMEILIFTGFPDESNVVEAFRVGAAGFLVKPSSANEITEAICRAKSSRPYIADAALRFLIETLRNSTKRTLSGVLSPRESQIMGLLVLGKQDKEIARELQISTSTVHTHITRIYSKLEVAGRKEAVDVYLGRQAVPAA